MNVTEKLDSKLEQLRKTPDSELLNEIGILLYMLKDYKNAELYLNKACLYSPENADFLYNYALVMNLQGKSHYAQRIHDAYLKLNKEDTGILEILAGLYYQHKAYKVAARIYDKLAELKAQAEEE